MGKPGSFRPGARRAGLAALCPVRAPCPSAAAPSAPGRPLLPRRPDAVLRTAPVDFFPRACGQVAKHSAPLAACPGRWCPRIRPAPAWARERARAPPGAPAPQPACQVSCQHKWGKSRGRRRAGRAPQAFAAPPALRTLGGRGRAGGSPSCRDHSPWPDSALAPRRLPLESSPLLTVPRPGKARYRGLVPAQPGAGTWGCARGKRYKGKGQGVLTPPSSSEIRSS